MLSGRRFLFRSAVVGRLPKSGSTRFFSDYRAPSPVIEHRTPEEFFSFVDDFKEPERKALPQRAANQEIKYNQIDDPRFTNEVGFIPWVYNENDPIACLREDIDSLRNRVDDVRSYLRFLRKRNVSQALEALKFITTAENAFVNLDSEFFSKFINSLRKVSSLDAHKAFMIFMDYKDKNPNLNNHTSYFRDSDLYSDLNSAYETEKQRLQLKLNEKVHFRLFNRLVDDNHVPEALDVYERFDKVFKANKFDINHYQKVIAFYILNDDLSKSLDTLQEMHLSGIQMTPEIGIGLMEACVRKENYISALNIYDMAYPDSFTYKNQVQHTDCTPMLRMALQICDKLKLDDRAISIFDRSEAKFDTVSAQTILSIVSRRYPKATPALFTRFGRIVKDYPSSYNSLLSSVDDTETLTSVFNDMKQNHTPSITTYNIMLLKLSDFKNSDGINSILEEMNNNNITRDSYTFDILVRNKILENDSELNEESILNLFKEMKESSIIPKSSTWNMILQLVLQNKLNSSSLNSIIDLFSSSSSSNSYDITTGVNDVDKLLKTMNNNDGITPDTYQYILLDLLEKQEFDQIFKLYESIKLFNPVITNIALYATIKSNDSKKAIDLYNAIQVSNLGNSYTHELIINACESWNITPPEGSRRNAFITPFVSGTELIDEDEFLQKLFLREKKTTREGEFTSGESYMKDIEPVLKTMEEQGESFDEKHEPSSLSFTYELVPEEGNSALEFTADDSNEYNHHEDEIIYKVPPRDVKEAKEKYIEKLGEEAFNDLQDEMAYNMVPPPGYNPFDGVPVDDFDDVRSLSKETTEDGVATAEDNEVVEDEYDDMDSDEMEEIEDSEELK